MNNRVRELRKQKGLTQDELAKALHVSRQTVNAIENNKYNPTLELAIRLARYIGLPVEQIFMLDE
ncbi:MAG: helix-turn-helix transcriptional regulator [Oscillospiraceae bacterium]|nr:helix-turn-helix transcriptional regulator [Oscillospiraceae bacterium]MBR3417138.1 helix-turn-helix transcriptional regulator [Oscillospiraceae bacterium]